MGRPSPRELFKRKASSSMQTALKPKKDPSQLKVSADGDGSSLIQRSTKPRNTKANPTETTPATPRSHSSARRARNARAFPSSNAPMLTAITAITSAIERKVTARLAPRVIMSPSVKPARPFSTRSQEFSFLELQTPAAIVQTPTASATAPISSIMFLLSTKPRRMSDPPWPSEKMRKENTASSTPQSASSHQLLIKG